MPKAQKHCKLHDFYAWTVQKNRKNDQKSTKKRPTRTSKTHLQILPSFFPPRTPKNVKTPAGWRILGEGRRQGRAPRVAKAMLSFPHYTARHRRIKGLRPLPPTPGLALHLRMAPTIGVSALGAGATGADSEQRNWENKNILPIVGNEMLQWMWYTAMWSPD